MKFIGLLALAVLLPALPVFGAMPEVTNIQKADGYATFGAPDYPVTISIGGGCVDGGCSSGDYDGELATVTVSAAPNDPHAADDRVALSIDPALNPGNNDDGYSAANTEGDRVLFIVEDIKGTHLYTDDSWFFGDKTTDSWALVTKGAQDIAPGKYTIRVLGGMNRP